MSSFILDTKDISCLCLCYASYVCRKHEEKSCALIVGMISEFCSANKWPRGISDWNNILFTIEVNHLSWLVLLTVLLEFNTSIVVTQAVTIIVDE